jgi:hypothetical protein
MLSLADHIPHTRDRVVTQSEQERQTPTEPPLRYDLDEGEPTVAGWKSPRPAGSRYTWLWALGAGSLLVGLVVWLLYGA